MIIVDASAMVNLLVGGDGGERVSVQLQDHDTLCAPGHFPIECASALWRLERSTSLSSVETASHLGSLAEIPVTLVDTDMLIGRAWRHRHSMRVADAFYVACAELLGLPLLTSDRRLARAATWIDVRLA